PLWCSFLRAWDSPFIMPMNRVSCTVTSSRQILCSIAPTQYICQVGNHYLAILAAQTYQETGLPVRPSIFHPSRSRGTILGQPVISIRLESFSMKCAQGGCHSMMRAT